MFHDHQDALEGPHFDTGLVDASGRLSRLHKGGGGYKGPSKSEQAAQKIEQLKKKIGSGA